MAHQTIEADDVVGSTIALPNVSGGLNKGLKAEHQQWEAGDRFFVVLEVVVVDYGFASVDRENPLGPKTRRHVGIVDGSTFATKKEVGELVDRQRARMALAKDEASGQGTIEHSAELELQHFAGRHKRLRKGCPPCEAERQLALDERAERAAARKAAKQA